jgi:hypothetical protein
MRGEHECCFEKGVGVMLRKGISILTLAAMLSLLYCSCEQGGMTDVRTPDGNESLEELIDRAGRIEVEEPGEIHNEVLTLYCGKHRPLSGGRLGPEEFTWHLSDCINQVFELRGIDVRVTPEHIAGLLAEFRKLKDYGVIDVSRPTREGLFTYLDHLVGQGLLEPRAAGEYRRALVLCDEHDSKGGSRQLLVEGMSSIKTGDAGRDRMFTDILVHSRDFWTGIEKEEIMVTALGDTLDPIDMSPEEFDFWEKIASYGTDALLGIACIVIVPITLGVSIAGLLASITASILVDYTWGDDWGYDYEE